MRRSSQLRPLVSRPARFNTFSPGGRGPVLSSGQWLGLLLLLLAGLLLRGWFYQPPASSDDIVYFTLASQGGEPLILPETGEVDHGEMRLVMLASIHFWTALFGHGLGGYYVTVYFHAALMGLGMALLGLFWSGRTGAFMMALLWVTSHTALLTDTRLLPNTPGTALGILGLALLAWAAAPGGGQPGVPAPPERPGRWVLLGALLLWGAAGVWETNVILVPLLLGLGLGAAVELGWFAWSLGDPWVRVKALLGYGVTPNPSFLFQGHTWESLGLRWVQMLRNTGSGELPLFGLALVGAFRWLLGWREPMARLKLLALAGICGFLAFMVTSTDPLVPLLRSGVRYYLLCLPFVYLAVVDLGLWGMGLEPGERGDATPGLLGLLVGLALLGLAGLNLLVAAQNPQLARNGNDLLFRMGEVLASAREPDAPTTLYLATGSVEQARLFLPDDGRRWEVVKSGWGEYPRPGYLLLDWRRLNDNTWFRYSYGHTTHDFYRVLDRHPMVMRQRAGHYVGELFLVGGEPIHRQRWDITGRMAQGWSREGVSMPGYRHPLGTGERIYSGKGPMLTPPQSQDLPKGRFVQLVVKLQGEPGGVVQLELLRWGEGNDPPRRQFLGRLVADEREREMAVWSWLPGESSSFRVVARGELGRVVLSQPRLYLLGRHPLDRVHEEEGAW